MILFQSRIKVVLIARRSFFLWECKPFYVANLEQKAKQHSRAVHRWIWFRRTTPLKISKDKSMTKEPILEIYMYLKVLLFLYVPYYHYWLRTASTWHICIFKYFDSYMCYAIHIQTEPDTFILSCLNLFILSNQEIIGWIRSRTGKFKSSFYPDYFTEWKKVDETHDQILQIVWNLFKISRMVSRKANW